MKCLKCGFTTTNEDDEIDKYLEVVGRKDFKLFGFCKQDLLDIKKYLHIKNITLKELLSK